MERTWLPYHQLTIVEIETSMGNQFKDKDHDEKNTKIRWMTNRLRISFDFLMTIPASYRDTTNSATLPF